MGEVSIVDVKPEIVLGMRKRGSYQEIGNMIPALFQFAESRNIQTVGHPIFVCHEMSPEEAMQADLEKNADVEVAVPIIEKAEESDDIKCYELSGGKMAKIIHKGPYEDCGPTYEKLFAWLYENSKTISGFTREVYLNDPREVSPEEILTEIYAPIE